MPRKVEIQQSDDYTDDDPYEISYSDGKSTRHKVTEQQISNLHIRVNDNFVMLKWMFLAHGCTLVILITLVILFATSSSYGEPADTSQTDNMTSTASVSVTKPLQENCENGWIDGRSVELGCIFIATYARNYSDSVHYCEEKGSHLIEIYTEKQMDFFRSQLSGGSWWWGGATNPDKRGPWYWTVSGEVVKDFVWAIGEPDTSNIYLCFANEGYYGHDCSGNFKPVCQKM